MAKTPHITDQGERTRDALHESLGHALRKLSISDGVKLHGKWSDLTEMAKGHWRRRAEELVEIARKHGVKIEL